MNLRNCIDHSLTDGIPSPKHWLVRVNDGENFRNSSHPFWGVKKGKNGCIKGVVDKLKNGDILWFITSKKYGGNAIGMGEYISYHDRDSEPLLSVHTYSNEEQNWKGDGNWNIQLHYKNLYITEKQNINVVVQCGGVILEYETFKNRIMQDLYIHYDGFKLYAEPKSFLCTP